VLRSPAASPVILKLRLRTTTSCIIAPGATILFSGRRGTGLGPKAVVHRATGCGARASARRSWRTPGLRAALTRPGFIIEKMQPEDRPHIGAFRKP
jgi:hypothetical protein